MLELRAETAAALGGLGERLGRVLRIGDVVGLLGPLGAGKTTFVQGIARGMGIGGRHVASPTFALVNEHPGPVPLVHADLYRIEDARELDELGLADACDRAAVAVEWLDRFPEVAPGDHLEVRITLDDDSGRRLTFAPKGERAAALVARLRSVTEL
jgi:tRNA threonylcarbamoyladenosine biosynthesis protein TsaE